MGRCDQIGEGTRTKCTIPKKDFDSKKAMEQVYRRIPKRRITASRCEENARVHEVGHLLDVLLLAHEQ